MDSEHAARDTDIAIIALSGRFPGARDVDELWDMLRNGREALTLLQERDLIAAGERPERLSDPAYVKVQGVVEDADLFDADFFNFSQSEAENTDPQQRLFLEQCSAALQMAGYDPDRFHGLIGVFAGAALNMYFSNNVLPHADATSTSQYMRILVGNDKDFLATRVSYKLNLKGPSYSIQTSCSTSLVAIHVACQALLSGECDMALAGGVTIRAQQVKGYLHEGGGVVSSDGHVRPFDAEASGVVPGGGVGVVVLKLLRSALADGDTIHAVVKGTATNNDGSSKANFSAPGRAGQVAVVREAQEVAGVAPDTVTYVEAHGTATKFGDPVEVSALTQAFRRQTSARRFCALGSVKSNLGHLDAAAGVTSVIKTVLMLRERALVPSINFSRPNPEIDFESSPFYVSTRFCDWPPGPSPRRAGVSAFGIGGTNAHAILEEAPEQAASGPARDEQVLLLSAKTRSALERMTDDLASHLRRHSGLSMADVAYTLAVGRQAFRYRRAVLCRDARDAARTLESREAKTSVTRDAGGGASQLHFIFSEEVADHERLSEQLARSEPEFKRSFDACVRLGAVRTGRDGSLFAYQYALARLWLHWGLVPTTLIAHGMGEVTAACLAECISLEEALAAIAKPSQFGALTRRGGRFRVLAREHDFEAPERCHTFPRPGVVNLTVGHEHPSHTLRSAWVAGAAVDWNRYYADQRRRRIPLPTYPFEGRRYWLEPRTHAPDAAVPLREGGVYVIADVSGRVALPLAEHIASRVKAHLVLACGSGLPASARARVEAVRAQGTSVLYVYARADDEDDRRELLARVHGQHARIDRFIDLGATFQDSFIRQKSDVELAALGGQMLAVAWPQMEGSLNPHGKTAERGQ